MNLALALFLAQKVWPPSATKDRAVESVTQIRENFFQDEGDVFVFYDAVHKNLLMEELLKDLYLNGNVLVSHYLSTGGAGPPPFIEPRGAVLFMDYKRGSYTDDVLSFISKIIANIHIDLRLVVVVEHEFGLTDDEVLVIFDNLWKINIGNVLLLNSITGTTPQALTIYHRKPNCNYNAKKYVTTSDLQKVILSADASHLDFLRNRDIFSIIDITNITGSYLNVSVAVTPPYVWLKDIHWKNIIGRDYQDLAENNLDGIEVAILREYRKKHDLFGFYIVHPSEIIDVSGFENKSDGYGVLEETALGISDIAIGGSLASSDLYMYFIPSVSYFEDNMYWYVPSAIEVPRWMNLFMIFDEYLWAFIVLALLSTSLVLYVIVRMVRHSRKDFSTAMLSIWSTLLSQPVNGALSGRLRILFLAAFLYGMHISAFYQSSLYRSLSDKRYEDAISTLEEAKSYNMELCLSGLTYDFFTEQNFDSVLGKNFSYSVYLNYADCLEKVSAERKSFALLPEKTTDFTIALRYLDKDHLPTVVKIPRKLIRYPVSMYLTKASPFRESLDFVITRLLESGIIDKWWDDIQNAKSRRRQQERNYSSISLKNAFGIFLVWLVPACLSAVTFLCELGWHEARKLTRKRDGCCGPSGGLRYPGKKNKMAAVV